MRRNAQKVIAIGFLILAFAFYIIYNNQSTKASFFSHNVTGYAWSSNIGWISFSCDDTNTCGTVNYGVDIDTNNNVTGQAWSSNIGWIAFGSSYTGPSGNSNPTPAKYDPATGNITGWAKAIAPNASNYSGCPSSDPSNDGCWDGWISLSGTGYGAKLGPTSSGQAWGSNVTGWIDFSGVKYTSSAIPASVTLSGPASAASGSPFILSWTSSNVLSCTPSSSPANAAWDSTTISPIIGGSKSGIKITANTTFTLTCVAIANATPVNPTTSVTVNLAPSGAPIVNTVGASPSINGATVSGFVNYNGYLNSPLALYFEWGPTASLGQTATGNPLSTSASTNFSGSISGLASGTTYYYRAVAKYPTLCKSCVYAYFYGPILAFMTSVPALPIITLTPWCSGGQGVLTLNTQNISAGSACSGSASTLWPTVPGTLPETKYASGGTYSISCGSPAVLSNTVTVPTTPCSIIADPPCSDCPTPPKKPKWWEF